MMFLAPRAWAAVAATLVLIASWFWMRPGEETRRYAGGRAHSPIECPIAPFEAGAARPTQ